MPKVCKIHVPMPTNWNAYIAKERANRYAASSLKRAEKEQMLAFQGMKYTGNYPCEVIVRAHFSNKRADLDNVRIKGILDGLVNAGVIVNDNLTKITKITYLADFEGEGLDIEITEHLDK